jgi:hypothetical protein
MWEAVMPQPIQNTDAYIMMQCGRDLQPLKGQPMTPELKKKLTAAAKPHADALLRNGHSKAAAISLIATVWNTLQ